ncbi:MAG TPA: RimK family alpha-L-glutamate ligase [Planctomycetaceae bacterium]|nr:RimK family alpha-L-glutamate ligase [Planctomycetaceae bacterium]
MKVGVFGNEESWYVEDLQRAGGLLGVECRRLDFREMSMQIETGRLRFYCGEENLLAFDAFIVRTMPPGSLEEVVTRMDLLERLRQAGKIVVNSPRAVECAVDKSLTTAKLAEQGVPVPATWVGETSEAAMDAFARLGGDVVVKPVFGAEGRGIVRVSDPDLAFRTFRTLERLNAVLYLQEFVPHLGYDVRVLVLDGIVLGAIRRESMEDFRTNIARNGKASECEIDDEQRELALRACDIIETRIAGVDLLSDAAGRQYVIELNAVPGWRAFRKATGIDVAARLLESIRDGWQRASQASACLLQPGTFSDETVQAVRPHD